ncbi:hypothetical protein V2O64_01685 [Verrucomicrobiaceae bacterium 227]
MSGKILLMRLIGQVCLGLLLTLGLFAQDTPAFKFDAPAMKESVFKTGLGLLDRERDEYATSLATFAANYVVIHKANKTSLDFARRALGLAMHLSSRNRKMMVLKHQLGKGIMPQKVVSEYSPKTLAALFVARAETLFEQKGDPNILLARALIDVAATVDPLNEDAVYAYELQKIDYGELDWKQFTEVTATGGSGH